ncbi:serine hydrolase domain-containing protein [Williamsia muralis]|uniref:Serine hydrolase domain-containing protein n=1 Tax=Williamsia marianensis TaxID=85044 RepID=A0ABU4ETS5_WILMA|nr:serine hydrolase domain-containing protein [Williamsia muralis]MDV7134657.1 serine hydrolase domain-containing protein [Williamsia muralis]
MKTHNRLGSAITVMALVSLVLSGCSSSSDESAASSESTASTTTPTTTVDPAEAAAFQKVLDDTRNHAGFPGVIAQVASPDGTWTGTSGTIGQGKTQAPAVTDKTRIGSLTKTMTATVLLQLVQEGKLSLDDTIGKYVPGMPNGDVATLLQLSDMTSGIPSYTKSDAIVNKFFANPEYAWPPQELVDGVKGLPADFAPGQGWEYSNTNYVLLGMVIEKVLGQPIADVFEQRLFGPLGMADTSFPGGSTEIGDPHMDGLTDQNQPPGQNVDSTRWNPSFAFTAGAVISTLDDLKKWGHALFTGEGVLDSSTQQFRRDSIIRDIPPNTATAGYGIGIGDRGGWWGHDGDIPGYNSVLFHNYDSDTTIIVLTNSDNTFTVNGKEAFPAPAVSAGLQAALG